MLPFPIFKTALQVMYFFKTYQILLDALMFAFSNLFIICTLLEPYQIVQSFKALSITLTFHFFNDSCILKNLIVLFCESPNSHLHNIVAILIQILGYFVKNIVTYGFVYITQLSLKHVLKNLLINLQRWCFFNESFY